MIVKILPGILGRQPPTGALAFLGGVLVFFGMGCSQTAAPNANVSQEARKVTVAEVEELPSEELVKATGALAAFDRTVLSAKVPGRLEKIGVDLGTKVKRGEVLAQIEQRDYELRRDQAEAALAQARARLGLPPKGQEDSERPESTSIAREARAVLEEASKNRERIVRLNEEGVIAEAEVEAAESSFQVATNRYEAALDEARSRLAILAERQADLALARQQLADTVIAAPFDGVVERRQGSPGDYLQPAAPILTLVRIDPVRLRAEVPERDAPRVRAGQKLLLQIEGSDLVRTGKVARLSPVIRLEDRMLAIEADFNNPDGLLRPGSFAKADIIVNEQRRGLFVPESAVVTFAGIQKIFTVQDGKAQEREVATGKRRNGRIEITRGIERDERVVLEPGTLRDGQPVLIAQRET